MKKYFIADILTALKFVPAVCILTMCFDPGAVFVLFVFGELLDALDGMAAKQWPHPPETEKLWFRKNIKLIESGLDLFLAVVTLVYVMVKINFSFGIVVLVLAAIVGIAGETLLYGKLFGTPKTAKENSLFRKNPKMASAIVGMRLLVYLAGVFATMFLLLLAAEWNVAIKATIVIVCFVVGWIILCKKVKDGRMEDVRNFLHF